VPDVTGPVILVCVFWVAPLAVLAAVGYWLHARQQRPEEADVGLLQQLLPEPEPVQDVIDGRAAVMDMSLDELADRFGVLIADAGWTGPGKHRYTVRRAIPAPRPNPDVYDIDADGGI
jgi:hypothetical protein